MKQKGVAKKAVKEQAPEVGQNEEAFLDFVNQNNKENPRSQDSGDDEPNFKSDSVSESSLSTSSSESGDSYNVLDTTTSSESSDESWVDRRLRRSIQAHGKSKHRKSKFSRKEKLKRPHHCDPRYSKKELKTALAVIKKVMKMDEAEPFNVPVDSVALGIPDYFDVIDNPMNFGTICKNLQTGVKYMNSEDVFNDAQYIWNNCYKYNNKDTYILNLMKRVKKKFLKYWTAAGLHSERQRKTSDSNMRYKRPVNSMGHVTGNFNPSQVQNQLPSSYSHAYLSQQPLPSPIQPQFSQLPPSSYSHPYPLQQMQPSVNQLQFSQLPAAGKVAGHSILQPPTHPAIMCKGGCSMRCNEYVPCCLMDHMRVNASQLQAHQSAVSHRCVNEGQEPQESVGQLQHSQLQPTKDFGNAGQSHASVTVSAMKNTRGTPKCSVDPVTESSNPEHQDLLGSKPQSHQPSEKHNEPHDESQQPGQKKKKRKRVRGPTRCLFLRDLPEGEKICVPLNNLGQPVGSDAAKLSSFLGHIARNGHMAPLTYVSWRHMPEQAKEEMWKLVQTKFDIDPVGKDWVTKSLASKWRDWKADLKANHYMPNKTDEERLKDCDERVLPDQWPVLVSFWNSEKAKKQSATNKANREKQKGIHTSGQKSFARIREEEREKRVDRKEPTRAELYVLTHTRKDGQPADEAAAATISKLREQAAQKQGTPEGSDSSDRDTFCQVMGEDRNHWARTYGLGPTPKRSKSHNLMRIALETKKAAKEDIQKVLEKMEAMEQKYVSIEAGIANISSSVQLLLEKFGVSSSNLGQVRDTPYGAADLQRPGLNSSAASYAFPSPRGCSH